MPYEIGFWLVPYAMPAAVILYPPVDSMVAPSKAVVVPTAPTVGLSITGAGLLGVATKPTKWSFP